MTSLRLAEPPPAPAAAPAPRVQPPAGLPDTRSPAPPRRSTHGTLLLPPWRRAPLLLFREPSVILAVAGAAAILALASASGLLFLSSASSEALHRQYVGNCPEVTGTTVLIRPGSVFYNGGVGRETGSMSQALRRDDATVRSAMAESGFAEPSRQVLIRPDAVSRSGVPRQIQLLHKDAAVDHITPVATAGGSGIWVPDQAAAAWGYRPGDSVPLNGRAGRTTARIVGTYRNLTNEPVTPFWCANRALFLAPGYGEDPPPFLLIASGEQEIVRLAEAFGARPDQRWTSPVDGAALTLTGADELNAHTAEVGRRLAGYQTSPDPELALAVSVDSRVREFAERTRLVVGGLRGPVVPVSIGASLVALLLVGAAGSYWADKRSREVQLLSSRGVGPGALAAKAALELAAPALIGGLVGWGLAIVLVRWLGPNSLLDPSAPVQAGLIAAGAVLMGLLLLATVAGLRSRGATERPVGARRSIAAWVPWELAVLGLALLALVRLRSGDGVVNVKGVAQVNLLLVAFPLLVLAGAVPLGVRLGGLGLPLLRRWGARRGPALFLATRRVLANRPASMILLAAASLPVGVLVYASGLTGTSTQTVDAKAGVIAGAPTQLMLIDRPELTPELAALGTVVRRYPAADIAGQEGQLLALDRATFAEHAYWDDRLAHRPLPDLLAALAPPATAGEPVPAIWVGSGPGPTEVRLATSTVPIRVVTTARTFPGQQLAADPMLIVDRVALGTVDRYAAVRDEVWTHRPAEDVQPVLTEQGVRMLIARTTDDVVDVSGFVAVTWTFGYLQALGALTALVAIGGLLLYLETRQRARNAAYALAVRGGLSRRAHLGSLVAELSALLLAGYALGAGLGWLAVLSVYDRLDVDTRHPPTPLLAVPVTALVAAFGAVLVVAVLAAVKAQRTSDRADISEVLRLGT